MIMAEFCLDARDWIKIQIQYLIVEHYKKSDHLYSLVHLNWSL